jgi:NADH-quinone oxidoreductase subunit H
MDWGALTDPLVNISKWISSSLRAFLSGLNLFGFQPAPDLVNVLVFLVMAIITITVILLVAPGMMMYMTWLERKLVARLQDRIGPNRVGPFGLLQPLADMIKFFTKEDITPRGADRWVHLIAPMVVVIPVVLSFAVIQFGRGIVAVDLNVGILYLVALGSMSVIGVFMAGFGSNNKFALIGAMRAVAQIVSYEVPQILAIGIIVLLVGSLSLTRIIEAQSGFFGLGWFIFYLPVGPIAFVIYLIAATAEINRVPFDLPEAESELVAGYHTEYTGMKFALFYLAEFLNTFIISAIGATLFLGGWNGPGASAIPLLGLFYMMGKTILLVMVQMWFRGTLPRIRVDQLMNFGWKVLVPVALALILLTGLLLPVYRGIISFGRGVGV